MAASGTYFWGNLVRIDVLEAAVSISLAFYGPKVMRVQFLPLLNDSCDHLSAVSAAGADVSSPVSAYMAASTAHSETLGGSVGGQQGEAGWTASTPGRALAAEEPSGIDTVHSRGALQVIMEVCPGRHASC